MTVVQDATPAKSLAADEPQAQGLALPVGLVKRADGVYFDLAIQPATLLAAVNHIFLSGHYFADLSYPALLKALFDVGPVLPAAGGVLRMASAVRQFDPERQALYKGAKIARDYAEYIFELLYLDAKELPDGSTLPERPARLDPDEFVADMWLKGVHFGLDMALVIKAIGSGKSERLTVATDLEPEPGQDAMVVEVSSDLHRSDAPRAKADGRIDLLSFQNRFPQIKPNMRLLKKVPSVPGKPGYDIAGRMTAPAPPKDLVLSHWCGDGTAVQKLDDGEYLVSTRAGFLSVDAKSSRISITDKIISLDGVSGRTTGNLKLAGAYEEYGDVQEQREVSGSDITVHGNVYGNINSRGGQVILDLNLVSGSVNNAEGDIEVKGVASGSVLHTRSGKITIGRAENCVISGSSVTIAEASNCEIIADEIRIGVAEGCAVAGRNVEIESAGPRKRTEMLIFILTRDVSQFDLELADLEARVTGFREANQTATGEIGRLAQLPDVRRYLALAAKLRNQELTLTPEQGQHLQKIAGAVGAELQAIARLKQELQAGQTQQKLIEDRLLRLQEQKAQAAGLARCGLHEVSGETLVRTMPQAADSAALHLLPAKDIKQRLRGTPVGGEVLFADTQGALDWHLSAQKNSPPGPE